ncbi:family 2 glycosyl hydrolase [Podospora didyma]|uniref:Family 2 glycosyl hydrolase n=1 Tax=Podospora didyma TaxID=330526 RepID=A0AAE0P5U0_9PEZI|nr:family 2 glycosyl hydrolase [Podospora didyma]
MLVLPSPALFILLSSWLLPLAAVLANINVALPATAASGLAASPLDDVSLGAGNASASAADELTTTITITSRTTGIVVVTSPSPPTAAASSSPSPAVKQPVPYKLVPPPLDTPWTDKVGTSPWPEHPRPLLRRNDWLSLNGIWTFQSGASIDGSTPRKFPESGPLPQEILIPSCIESGISGFGKWGADLQYMWFERVFRIPEGWDDTNKRILLNFEAVDYEAVVYVNGNEVGSHEGGYDHFSFDVTGVVDRKGDNVLRVFVFDPTDQAGYNIPSGKQTLFPSHIWYTPCSGIWQTVWLESVPTNYIAGLDIHAGMDGNITVTVHAVITPSTPVRISLQGGPKDEMVNAEWISDEQFWFMMPPGTVSLWSPDSPNLYNITVTMGDDVVSSYTGFRTVSSGLVDGVQRPLLNGKFVFQFGTLDQGYWPDGIYTPPTYEAMVYDLKLLKSLGMNMVRKHIKVESDLFYQACDQLGLFVVQDMPAMHSSTGAEPDPIQQKEFERQLEIMVNQHKSFPSIVTWVIYNEGWGQIRDAYHPEFALTDLVRRLDPTRLVDATTGWFDHGAGDFSDNHKYAEPQCGTPWFSLASSPYDPKRIGFQGEFGGLGQTPSPEHLWPLKPAIDTLNQTYELHEGIDSYNSYNYRAHVLFGQLRDQIAMYACSGAVYTQTSDVEGEVNGLVSYDRRFVRVNVTQWQADIKSLYEAAELRA